jgi:Tat protein translocase TatB subunit
MGNLGGSEVLVILLVGLLVLGPTRLPEVTRQIGRVLREVRRISTGFQDELRAAVEDPGLELEARARGDALTSGKTSPSTAGNQPDSPTADTDDKGEAEPGAHPDLETPESD